MKSVDVGPTREYRAPEILDLGSIINVTEGIKDLLTDNHNGTWQRIEVTGPRDPAGVMAEAVDW